MRPLASDVLTGPCVFTSFIIWRCWLLPLPVADYRVALAHGLADLDNATNPFESALFGHTHSMGWFNRYQVPFQRRVRVTMQCQRGHGAFWVRVGGLENAPITWGNLQVRLTGTLLSWTDGSGLTIS